MVFCRIVRTVLNIDHNEKALLRITNYAVKICEVAYLLDDFSLKGLQGSPLIPLPITCAPKGTAEVSVAPLAALYKSSDGFCFQTIMFSKIKLNVSTVWGNCISLHQSLRDE